MLVHRKFWSASHLVARVLYYIGQLRLAAANAKLANAPCSAEHVQEFIRRIMKYNLAMRILFVDDRFHCP